MTLPIESAFSLMDIARGIFRHKWKAFFFFLLAMILVGVALTSIPNTYNSEAKLFFRVGPESGPSPTSESNSTGLSIEDPREGMINSALDILRSRKLIEEAVSKIGAERILHGDKPEDEKTEAEDSPLKNFLRPLIASARSIWPKEVLSTHELAVQKLTKSIDLYAEKRSYILTVQAEAGSPKLAQDICAALVSNYQTHHVSIHQTADSVVTLERSLAETEKELLQKRGRLEDYRSAVGESSDIQRLIAKGRSKDKITEVRQLLAQSLRLKQQGKWDGDVKFKPFSPSLDITQVTPDNVAPQYRQQFNEAIAVYNKSIDTLAEFKLREIETKKLQDDIERLKTQLNDLEKRTKQARLEARLSEDLITSVQVSQPATFVEKAVSPKKSIILLLGLIAATTGSFVIVFVCEVCDSTLKTTDEVERYLNLPVLVSIPRRRDRAFLYR